MKKFLITEEERNRIRGLYEQVTPQSTSTTQTISSMLQGKEFPRLTKQEDSGTVYYSLLEGQKRLWYISFKIKSNNWIETKIVSTNPNYFTLVETLFNSLKSFSDIGKSAGLDKSSEMVIGVKQTKIDKVEINKIFDTLVQTNNTIKQTPEKQTPEPKHIYRGGDGGEGGEGVYRGTEEFY